MMQMRKWLAWSTIIAGAVIGVAGTAFVLMYFWHAIVARIGEPDQSLIFWYLPVLFIGLAGCGAGLALYRWGAKRLRQSRGG